MRELHLLLFYLIHGYTGDENLDQQQAIDNLKLDKEGSVGEREEEELGKMKIYSSELSWRTFVPPLPHHQGWGEGWCLMCDILLRLPLSIFVKLVNITFDLPGLEEYLDHPVRRHYLIRALPHHIRNRLLFQRKYIFSVHEVASRLAYIGALQFGPQKLKEKDQVFLFLNRTVTLLDTRSSAPGYHQIEADKDYPVEEYRLSCLQEVEQYWHRMWEICLFTPLGGPSSVTGQEITLEVMEKKPAMLEALSPRTAEEATAADDGSVPGDGLGAAGLDSSIFAHLKRNWTWNAGEGGGRRGEKLTPSFILPGETSIRTEGGVKRVVVGRRPNEKRTTKGQKRKRATSPKPKSESSRVSGRPAVTKRLVTRKVTQVVRKPYYDEKDKAALRLMRKLRVDWSAREDSFLLLCKVAGAFLCANARNQMVAYTLVRDLLHSHFPESSNKTSRACQRRLNYMLRNQSSADDVALFLEDARQDQEIVDRFQVPLTGELGRAANEVRIETDFAPLVELLMAKYRKAGSDTGKGLQLPSTLAEVEAQYNLVFPGNQSRKETGGFSKPKDIADIQAAVVNALITSSLCSASDKKSWAYQLYKIYQQYPDSLLREVMIKLRDNKMVSLKKAYNKVKVKEGNYLPLSSAPYQLSVTFAHTFLCRYQYDIYHQVTTEYWPIFQLSTPQAWQQIRALLANPDEHTEIVIGQEGGFAAAMVELMAEEKLHFRVEVPEQLVVLDPSMQSKDENYVRILQR